ncbi:MAG: hypothetical protein C5S38_01715 [Candidatus Methanophagaceae archaeon]|nr:MAG: hypothetical protein C5S38_01715 [Methanophagales archaeon]
MQRVVSDSDVIIHLAKLNALNFLMSGKCELPLR